MTNEAITTDDLLKFLKADIKKAGSGQAWLERHGVSEGFLSETLNERRQFPLSIAEKLGYELGWMKKK